MPQVWHALVDLIKGDDGAKRIASLPCLKKSSICIVLLPYLKKSRIRSDLHIFDKQVVVPPWALGELLVALLHFLTLLEIQNALIFILKRV